MKLSELKMLLAEDSEKDFRIVLPDGATVPVSFHVTEVGRIQKTFLDCGGKLRERVTCQLQVWVGEDYDHRIEVEKMASILEIAKPYLPDESIPVEIEYERNVISQYTIQGTEISDDSVVLQLAHKPSEFLTTEFCGLPAIPVKAQKSEYCCSHE